MKRARLTCLSFRRTDGHQIRAFETELHTPPLQFLRELRDVMVRMQTQHGGVFGRVDLEVRSATAPPCAGARIRFHLLGG